MSIVGIQITLKPVASELLLGRERTCPFFEWAEAMLSLHHLRRLPEPVQVILEKIAYVLYPELEHREPVYPYAPRNRLSLYPQILEDFGPEHPRAAEFHPAELRVLRGELHRWFGERIVIGKELHFLRARNFLRELLQHAEEVREIQVLAHNEPLGLVELYEMRRVKDIWPEAPRNREIFPRHLNAFGELPRAVRGSMRGRHEPLRYSLEP